MTTRSASRLELLRSFLKGNTLLGGMPEAELEILVRKGRTRTFAKGDVIYRRGEPGDSIMVIRSGRVKITNINADAREVVLAFLGPGDIAGEIAVLHSGQRTANAIALEKTDAFLIAGRDVLIALKASPQALIEMSQMLCEKLQAASAIIEDSTLAMQGRTANGLLRLAYQHGLRTRDGSIRIDLKLTQDDIGKYLGLSRSNVSRQLRHLKDLSVIKIEGAQVVIIDETNLAELAKSAWAHD